MQPLSANDPRTVGEFTLHARLGAGGMGRVYLGHSPAGRAVAVKVVHPELARDEEFLARFRNEVAAARAVSGMYTAPVVASGLDDNPPWLATVFVPGPSLEDVVGKHGPLPEPALWRLAAGLAEALAAVHACGVVHRDLKPSNVLLAADGPHVIDFGISRAFDGTHLTATGIVVGTPGYMSPEQAEGHQAGPECDVFSLACVLAYAATAAQPFGGGSAASVLYRVVKGEPDLAGVPARLREVLAACLRKNPAQRPPLSVLATTFSRGAGQVAGSPASFWPPPAAEIIRAATQEGPEAAVLAESGKAGGAGAPSARMQQAPTFTPAPQPARPAGLPAQEPAAAAQPADAFAASPGVPAASQRTVHPQAPYQQDGVPSASYAPPSYLQAPAPGTLAPPWQPPAPQGGPAWQAAAPHGQPSYGPYGQPTQQSAMPSAPGFPPIAQPGAGSLHAYRPARRKLAWAELPGQVRGAVQLMYLATAITLGNVVASSVAFTRLDHFAISHPYDPVGQAASKAAGVLALFPLTGGLIGIAGWLLIAAGVRRGHSWAAVTGTVLFGLNTIATIFILAGARRVPRATSLDSITTLTAVIWALGLIVTVLVWQSPVRAFFASSRNPS